MSKVYEDPGERPPPGATPREIERWRRENERFLTEGGRPGVSKSPASVDPTDARLKALRYEHHRFLEMRNPFKAAIWLELMRAEKDVIHDAEMSRRFAEAQAGQGQKGVAVVAPSKPAILAIANRQVAAALRGDQSAIAAIAERIEGKTGLRVGDEAEDDPAHRKAAQQAVSDILAQLTNSRIKSNDKIVDVTPEVVDNPSKDSV